MANSCSIRALWILNSLDAVVFSRRFPVVEKRWRAACQRESETSGEDPTFSNLSSSLPNDSDLAAAFSERKRREGSVRGYGIRVPQSTEGSDSWVDDPITRHIIGLYIKKEEEGGNYLLWPLILHIKSLYCVLALPFVEPRHLKAYARLCKRSDCGTCITEDGSLSSLLLDLPSITGYGKLPSKYFRKSMMAATLLTAVLNSLGNPVWAFMVVHAIGDVVTGDFVEPDVIVNASPSVGGLLDSLTGSIGISARAKPAAAPLASSAPSGSVASGAVLSDVLRTGLRLVDKDALRSFISNAMPFGIPLDLSYSNISAIRTTGFSSSDLPPQDLKQPAWKPYLYKGKQRVLFTIHEIVHAAMYDRDEIPDSLSVSGQINCRAELEGLPDVSFPLTGVNMAQIEVLSFHPCAQVPEQGVDKQTLMFSPPLGNFVLMRYQTSCSLGPAVKGFYQLSMVSEDEGAFLFKLCLMEGYKVPLVMEFCNVIMPFPRRRVVSIDGTPSVGTISFSEHSVEWKIITSGRGLSGRSIETTFPGTVRFAPWQSQKQPTFRSGFQSVADEDSDDETENSGNMVNLEEFLMEKMNKDLPPVDMEEPYSWQAYDYAKVSFRIIGASVSGMSIEPKSVNIYPAAKAPVEISSQVLSGYYVLWNTLGKCPSAASPKA